MKQLARWVIIIHDLPINACSTSCAMYSVTAGSYSETFNVADPELKVDLNFTEKGS
jgi:hypothetical protein